METKDHLLPDLPPLTLEEADEWLSRLEDIATTERDLGFATRFILVNFIAQMAQQGFDAPPFLAALEAAVGKLEQQNEKLALEVLLEDLRETLQWRSPPPVGLDGIH